jgi:hypothetical protein
MSTSTAMFSNDISHNVIIYLGIPILIAGIIGGICNVVVLLSLETFRKNSCAFYLMIMSMVNIVHLITGLFSRIMISGFNTNWAQYSLFFCKFRAYTVPFGVTISFTCMCLATIDQFLATCSQPRWQQWSHIKTARRLVIIFTFIWLLHGIPYIIYYDHVTTANGIGCITTNNIFQLYVSSVQTIGFYGLLPICLNPLFGLLAYRNVKDLAYRTIPLVRRELDRQMTVIVLIQAVYNCLASIPYLIVNIFILMTIITNDSTTRNQLELANVITLCIFYLNFAVSQRKINAEHIVFLFYVYIRFHSICFWVFLVDFVNNLCLFSIELKKN